MRMRPRIDPNAPRKATNLSVNADLLARAREHGINLSATLERALIDALRQRQRRAWLEANQGAIDAYNAYVDERGVFSDHLRTF
jgi:antitoxin CcdA